MSPSPALQAWIEAHPYLAPVARFERLVEAAVAGVPAPEVRAPHWSDYAAEYERGVPLLRSAVGAFADAAAADVLGRIAERLAAAPLQATLAAQLQGLRQALSRSPEDRAAVVAWARAGAPAEGAPPGPGLAAFLAWSALRRVLAPVVAAFGAWRCEEKWSRGTCPTCGAPPGMSQLVTDGAIRQRHLVCGCCATRWKFKRLACPHCASEDVSRLGVLELDGLETVLRIDSCEECSGYVKTYTGDGDEALFLADWTTLHLDALAKERGLRRAGVSLFAL